MENITCLVIGIVATQLISWSQFRIKNFVAQDKNALQNQKKYKPIPSIWFMIMSRIFSVIWGFADIYLWKGIWDGVDCYFAGGKKDWAVAATTFTVGLIILTLAGNLIIIL